MILGAQFYTLREHCKTLDGLADALARVADIGYTAVQISGTCAYEPEWLRDQLKKNGLACAITHSPSDKIAQEYRQLIANHTVFDCPYIGVGCGKNKLQSPADMEDTIALAKEAGAAIHAAGKQLMYHNHNFEFTRDYRGADGTLITRLEYLMEHTTPQELGVTLDTYWVQAGGKCVTDIIRQLSGRIPCVHLKDMAMAHTDQHMAPVGRGNLNWDAILPALEDAGVRYALVEQDETYGEDPFACLQQSYDYLRSRGLR